MSESFLETPHHTTRPQPQGLADVLDRVLDKGVVIAGDISISILDIELLTIRIRLLIASIDKAQEMGINWWQTDTNLTTRSEVRVEAKSEGKTATLKERTDQTFAAKPAERETGGSKEKRAKPKTEAKAEVHFGRKGKSQRKTASPGAPATSRARRSSGNRRRPAANRKTATVKK